MDVPCVHSFVCRRAPGRTCRHHGFNNLITRSFSSAGFPVTKEPSGLFRSDGKRPYGLTFVAWSSGKALCWDVRITCTLVDSYIMQPLESQARPQSSQLPARKRSTLILMLVIFLNRSPLTHSAYSTHQLASSYVISVGKSLSTRGKSEKRAFSFKDARCSCNVLMLYYITTVYLPLTALADCSYPFCVIYNFKNPLGIIFTEGTKNKNK